MTLISEAYKTRYKALNKAQKEAVDSTEGPVMVIAGPGTGKTTILTLRIAKILQGPNTTPSGVLALTFTDAGVKVMRMKLRELIGTIADEVRIHTFHGFASSVISEFPEHFPHLSRTSQVTDIEAESILREILKNKKYSKLRPLGDTDFYLYKILSAISECKKEAWLPDTVRNFAKEEIERVKEDESYISTRGATKGELKGEGLKRIERCERTLVFADVFEEYEAKKSEEKKMDFDDLLGELLKALKKDKLLLQLLQEKYLYILVDEHQDTNDSQNLIVTLISSFFKSPNIFVVGDEKQAIYRFQGASVENFLRFQNFWKDMKVISLTDNYRSNQSILDATFAMIEKNYEEGEHKLLRAPLKSGTKFTKKPVELVFTKDTDGADHFLVEELKKITKNEPEKTVAVIVRWNRDIDHIMSLCENSGISVSAERGADIFSHPLGTLYFNVLEYLFDPSKTESLAQSIAGGLWNLDFVKSNELIKKLRSGTIESIEKEIPQLLTLKKEITKLSPLSFLITTGDVSGLTSPEKISNPIYVEVWRGILDLAGDIAKRLTISNPRLLIKELLDYKKSAERKSIKVGSGNIDSNIHVMTAHSSKGLEYDCVFLPYSLEEYWLRRPQSSPFVLPREKDNSDELKDSRRLFYVALTRAKERAVLIMPKSDNLGNDFTPLRFTEELHKDHVLKNEVKNSRGLPKTLGVRELSFTRKKELVEYTKRILSENGLSVTALNHFMNCQSEFLYKSILKVPEAPSPSSEKGIAMHKALSHVWQSGKKDVNSINKILSDSIKEYFKTSLLSISDKEVVLDELLSNSPKVASALESHFALRGKVFTEKWIENHFETRVEKKDLRLKIHGQMDTIIDTDKKLLVFDYKTREALSENAIKGETKDSDGGYFRQLVFYKILLQKNTIFGSKEVEPSLVFVKPDSKGRCPTITLPILDKDVERVKNEINTLLSSVYSGEFLTAECDDKKCQYCGQKRLLE